MFANANTASRVKSKNAGKVDQHLVRKSIAFLKAFRKNNVSGFRKSIIDIIIVIGGGKNSDFMKNDIVPGKVGLFQTALGLLIKISKAE